MKIHFYKFHGTGNDFVILDNRNMFLKDMTSLYQFLCDRHFGIGADGVMLFQEKMSMILKWCISMLMVEKVQCAVMAEDV